MKKALHILLLSFYLLSNTDLQELTKLPVLFEHYFEHKNLDQKMTFLGYLEHHYNDIPHTDNDEERDNQLPFKTQDFFSSAITGLALPPSYSAIPKHAQQVISKQKIQINNDLIPHASFAGKIWQPPKLIILS